MLTMPEINAGNAYSLSVQEALDGLDTRSATGLSQAEVNRRLAQYGRNELPVAPPVPGWKRFLAQFQNPLTYLLLAATFISLVAWIIERDTPVPYETLTILAIVLLNGILGYVQENRAEQAVASLKAMSAPTARILRGGQIEIIPAAETVPGDILVVEEGDTIPADARVIESHSLRMAESALTGESAPVSKYTNPLPPETGLADRQNILYSGTAVTSGRGRALVISTGEDTEIGKIAGSLQEAEDEVTPLQLELDKVGKLLGIIVILIAIVVGATILLVDRINSLRELVNVLLIAVSLAVAAVPEGLTAITTIVLSLGMQRMADRNVIVRKLAAVETLGSTTVICTDKTGTLTRNEMTVRAVLTPGGRVDLTGSGFDPQGEVLFDGKPLHDQVLLKEVHRALRAAALANNALLSQKEERWLIQGDPTEGALLVAALKAGLSNDRLLERFSRVGEVPFSSERKLMSTAHTDTETVDQLYVAAKGAPDILLSRCISERAGEEVRPLTPERQAEILAGVEKLAGEALRTIGVAYRRLPETEVEYGDEHECELVWLGVVGMIDPPRPEARESVRKAQQAGIRVIMITGDHPVTAAAIATELSITRPGERVIPGAELQKTEDKALEVAVKEVSVYARVSPEHKLRIVKALRANGEITAMTGDGVNDAPALKSADIGVAMGITGTDVSKGAADMILTDDNFSSIVAAVEEGRSIFANIQKFLFYLLSSNIGEVLTMFLGVILAGLIGLVAEAGSGVVAPLLSTQILWINLLTDSAPALALGMEPADPSQMRQPPRDPRSRVITRRMWINILLIGFVVALATLVVMDMALPGGFFEGTGDIHYAQTMAFTTLVFGQLFNVFNSRSDTHSVFDRITSNRWVWIAVIFSLVLQIGVVYLPFLQSAFSTVPLNLFDWLLCAALSSAVIWVSELAKLLHRNRVG